MAHFMKDNDYDKDKTDDKDSFKTVSAKAMIACTDDSAVGLREKGGAGSKKLFQEANCSKKYAATKLLILENIILNACPGHSLMLSMFPWAQPAI